MASNVFSISTTFPPTGFYSPGILVYYSPVDPGARQNALYTITRHQVSSGSVSFTGGNASTASVSPFANGQYSQGGGGWIDGDGHPISPDKNIDHLVGSFTYDAAYTRFLAGNGPSTGASISSYFGTGTTSGAASGSGTWSETVVITLLVPFISQILDDTTGLSVGATSGGNHVTVYGSNFDLFTLGTQILIGGHACTSVIVVDASTITCITPPSSTTGLKDVRVTNPDGETYLLVDGWTYMGPTITSVSPNYDGIFGGADVLVTGSGFKDVTNPVLNIFFGSSQATNIFVLNDNEMSCFVPAHAKGVVNVEVQLTDLSSATLTNGFTYEQYSFTLENPLVPIRVGDKVKFITDISESAAQGGTATGILNGVTQIQLSYVDPVTGLPELIIINTGVDDNESSNYIIAQQSNELWFYLPIGFGTFSGTVTVTFIGDGIQFSGSVVAGTLQVLFEDASGIYSLKVSQTNDILYFRAGYITDTSLLMLPTEDEIYEDDDFFSMLNYPYKILAQSYVDEEFSDFSIISILRIPIALINVEIPSPFIRTAFLP